jgi:hypothetical protein
MAMTESVKVNDGCKAGMKERTDERPRSQSGSFLLRFWVEPSAGPGEPALRGCLRNLQTGEEHYLNDPGKVGDLVLRHLDKAPRGS